MNQTNEKLNKDLVETSIKSLRSAYLSDQKRNEPYKVSNKELANGVYFWDPALRQFIKFGR